MYAIPRLEEAFLDLLDAIGKGFAVVEVQWERIGRQARVAELRWIPQKRITFVEDLVPRLLTDKEPWRGGDPALAHHLPPLQGPKRL